VKACFQWLGHYWEAEVTLRLLHDRTSHSLLKITPVLGRRPFPAGHAVASPVPLGMSTRGGTIDAKISRD
jgi:hypothetical protein